MFIPHRRKKENILQSIYKSSPLRIFNAYVSCINGYKSLILIYLFCYFPYGTICRFFYFLLICFIDIRNQPICIHKTLLLYNYRYLKCFFYTCFINERWVFRVLSAINYVQRNLTIV
jgi:hypothetical protein